MVRDGEVSASELVDEAIGRLEELNPQLNAVIHPLLDQARATTPQDGPFKGVPFLVKDLSCYMEGVPVHEGMRALRAAGYRSDHDMWITRKFREAGFVILGRTNTPELGILPTTEPVAYGPTHNPWDLERVPGQVTKLAHACNAALDRRFVKVIAEDIDAIRAGQVIALVAVKIGDRDAARRLHQGGGRQLRSDHAAVLKWHSIGVGKLQIGDGLARLRGAPDGFGKAGSVERRQSGEARSPPGRDLRRRAVGTEEAVFTVVVERHQAGKSARDPGVAGERAVLGLRQIKPLSQGHHRGRNGGGAKPVESKSRSAVHRIAV